MSAFTIYDYTDTTVTIRATGLTVGNTVRFFVRLSSDTSDTTVDSEYTATSSTMTKTFSGLDAGTGYTVNVHDGDAWLGAQTFTTEAASAASWVKESLGSGTLDGTAPPYLGSFTAEEYTLYYYKLTAEIAGTLTAYTIGSLDTCGYIGGSTSIDTESGEPVSIYDEDDDSGGSGNFSLTYEMDEGDVVYVWVRCYDADDSGTTQLIIDFAAAAGTWEVSTAAWGTITEKSAEVTLEAYTIQRYSFTAAVSGTLTACTTDQQDTIGYLSRTTGFDSAAGEPTSYLTMDDDSGTGSGFSLTWAVSEGETYYLWVRAYVATNTPTVSVSAVIEAAGGGARIYDGSAWATATPYVWTGSEWVRATPYIYDGASWERGI